MVDIGDSEETYLDTVVETDDQQRPRDEEGRTFGKRRSDHDEDTPGGFEGVEESSECRKPYAENKDDVDCCHATTATSWVSNDHTACAGVASRLLPQTSTEAVLLSLRLLSSFECSSTVMCPAFQPFLPPQPRAECSKASLGLGFGFGKEESEEWRSHRADNE
jgi:hypothetical protein